MKLYCGIDLHSSNSVIAVLNEQDKPVYEKRLNNCIFGFIVNTHSDST